MPILDPEIETVRVILPRPQVIRLSDTEIAPGSGGGTFIQLTDVPNSYAGQTLKIVRVNAGETGLEFSTAASAAVWGSITGTLSNQTDLQAALNAKQNTLAIGNLTDVGTDGITIGSGTGAVIGSGTTISQHVADTSHNGYLSSTDWNTFNGKSTVTPAALTKGDDANVTLALTGTPSAALLQATTITAGWTGTLAPSRGGTGVATVPSSAQLLVGNAGGTAYAPQTLSGSGATISLASTGVLTLSAIANATLSNSAITIAGTSTALGGSITLDTILGLSSVGLVKRTASNTLGVITDSSTNWDTAFSQTRQWDGGSTGLTAATGRTSLGATTVGGNIFQLANPSAITFLRMNADNSVTALDAASFRTAIGAGTGSGDALTTQPLSQFASTTSAQLRGVLSDELGTGAALFDGATPTSFIGTNISGTAASLTAGNATKLTTGRTISLTGDVTYTSGSFDGSGNVTGTATLANIPAIAGTNLTGTAANLTAGNATKWTTGRTVSLTGDVTYTSGSLDGSGNVTGTATLANIPAIAGTNLTGTAANLTAGNVTTNANLTGPITSSGNATAIASQTGTGTKFVVDTSPTLITPVLGTPSSATLNDSLTYGHDLTAVPNQTGGWSEFFVTGSNYTNATNGFTDAIITSTLSNSTLYEFELVGTVSCSASGGSALAIHGAGTGSAATTACIGVATITNSTFAQVALVAVDTASNTFLTLGGSTKGAISVKGFFTSTSTGTATLSIQLKSITNTQTTTLYVGSVLRVRKAHT